MEAKEYGNSHRRTKIFKISKRRRICKKDLSGESIDIEISEMDVSPPEQFTKYDSVVSRDYQSGVAAYYVPENSFSCNLQWKH